MIISDSQPASRVAVLRAAADACELDDLAAAVWVQAYDAAWLAQDWSQLARRLDPDVKFVADGFRSLLAGRAAVIASLREAMSRTRVHGYNATDLTGHSCRDVGVIHYRWQLDWTIADERRAITGRDVLVLRAVRGEWLLVWRAQIRA